MRRRLSTTATRAVRSAIGAGATRLARNDWLMNTIYDLTNETNFSGLAGHEEMLSDTVRVDAYHRAIHRQIQTGDVVVDLGSGTGLLACMAIRAGAAKVYAVEHSDLIDLAREIAAHNGITGIEFIQANSRDFSPPESVDVVLHEQMGDELFNENMVENVLDLRNRALRSGGRILPANFRLYVEPVTFHDAMRVRRFWNIELPDDIDLAPTEYSPLAHRFDDGRNEQLWVRPGSVATTVGAPVPVVEFDLHTLESIEAIRVDHVVERTADADCIVDGFCVWFEADLDEDTSLTTSPLAPVTSWGNRLFRVDEELGTGDVIRRHVNLGDLVDPSTWSVNSI